MKRRLGVDRIPCGSTFDVFGTTYRVDFDHDTMYGFSWVDGKESWHRCAEVRRRYILEYRRSRRKNKVICGDDLIDIACIIKNRSSGIGQEIATAARTRMQQKLNQVIDWDSAAIVTGYVM